MDDENYYNDENDDELKGDDLQNMDAMNPRKLIASISKTL
jgi:hypothetical protein